MSERWKPTGYSTVSPYLVATNAQRVLDFAAKVFGAVALRRYDREDGTILHAEFRIDDTVIMLSDGGPDYPPVPSLLHVYVSDVDATYARALAAGATGLEAPKTQPGDPDKRGMVKDPCGNTWAISTQVS